MGGHHAPVAKKSKRSQASVASPPPKKPILDTTSNTGKVAARGDQKTLPRPQDRGGNKKKEHTQGAPRKRQQQPDRVSQRKDLPSLPNRSQREVAETTTWDVPKGDGQKKGGGARRGRNRQRVLKMELPADLSTAHKEVSEILKKAAEVEDNFKPDSRKDTKGKELQTQWRHGVLEDLCAELGINQGVSDARSETSAKSEIIKRIRAICKLQQLDIPKPCPNFLGL